MTTVVTTASMMTERETCLSIRNIVCGLTLCGLTVLYDEKHLTIYAVHRPLYFSYHSVTWGLFCFSDPRFILGLLLFIAGYIINRWADWKLRSLRNLKGDGRHFPQDQSAGL
jgi:hypothetical protein